VVLLRETRYCLVSEKIVGLEYRRNRNFLGAKPIFYITLITVPCVFSYTVLREVSLFVV